MLTKKQVTEIKEHLNKAQNPVFFFDNDQDGLCSFLLLQRYIERGKGVAIKSFPDLSAEYFRKVHELSADYIFILDKPVVSDEFFAEAEKTNIPVVWIDHHAAEKEKIPDFVSYYNPTQNKKKTDEPVTALCYQVTNKKEDLWLALVGCISDRYVPKFYAKFEKKYPDLALKSTAKSKTAADIFYKSQIGKITKILGFGLKDSITNVVGMIKFLMKVKNPDEVLEDNTKTRAMHHRFEQVESKYQSALKKAISIGKDSEKILFFQYGGDLSMSSDLSNELMYNFPEKIIIVVYMKGAKANISVRGKKAKLFFLKAIEDIDGAMGGGHEVAVGGQMKIEDVEKFKENMEKVVH
ncbi:MAG: DHH family phosphoesterase [Nanoarchaeota archaeon]